MVRMKTVVPERLTPSTSSSSSSSKSPWPCPRCTFENDPMYLSCSVCEGVKPSSKRSGGFNEEILDIVEEEDVGQAEDSDAVTGLNHKLRTDDQGNKNTTDLDTDKHVNKKRVRRRSIYNEKEECGEVEVVESTPGNAAHSIETKKRKRIRRRAASDDEDEETSNEEFNFDENVKRSENKISSNSSTSSSSKLQKESPQDKRTSDLVVTSSSSQSMLDQFYTKDLLLLSREEKAITDSQDVFEDPFETARETRERKNSLRRQEPKHQSPVTNEVPSGNSSSSSSSAPSKGSSTLDRIWGGKPVMTLSQASEQAFISSLPVPVFEDAEEEKALEIPLRWRRPRRQTSPFLHSMYRPHHIIEEVVVQRRIGSLTAVRAVATGGGKVCSMDSTGSGVVGENVVSGVTPIKQQDGNPSPLGSNRLEMEAMRTTTTTTTEAKPSFIPASALSSTTTILQPTFVLNLEQGKEEMEDTEEEESEADLTLTEACFLSSKLKDEDKGRGAAGLSGPNLDEKADEAGMANSEDSRSGGGVMEGSDSCTEEEESDGGEEEEADDYYLSIEEEDDEGEKDDKKLSSILDLTRDDEPDDDVENFSDEEQSTFRRKQLRLNGVVLPDYPQQLPHFRSLSRLAEAGDHSVEWTAMTTGGRSRAVSNSRQVLDQQYEQRRRKREAKDKKRTKGKKRRRKGRTQARRVK